VSDSDEKPEKGLPEEPSPQKKSRVIFLSYSNESAQHTEKVLGLSERLRKSGFDTRLDLYVNGSPEEGWLRWMGNQLDEADRVLLICTETYHRRFWGREEPGRGKGAGWESTLIAQEVYELGSKTKKFVPVLFDESQEDFIPEPLAQHSHYLVSSEEGYKALRDALSDKGGIEPGEIGPLDPDMGAVSIPASTLFGPIKDSRPWLRFVVAFLVALPAFFLFLGIVRSPGYETLRSIFLEHSQLPLIPASAFFLILAALGVQFYSTDRFSLPKLIGALFLGLFVGIGILSQLANYVVPVKGTEEFRLIGWSRLPKCGCGDDVTNEQCLDGLGEDFGSCWSDRSVDRVRTCFQLTFFLEAGGIGAFLGLVVLQGVGWRRRSKRK